MREDADDQHVFDAVVLAMPPRDAQRVTRNVAEVTKSVRDELDGVQWAGRFSIALWWSGLAAKAASDFIGGVEEAMSVSSVCHGERPSVGANPVFGVLDTVVRQLAPHKHSFAGMTHLEDTCDCVSVVIQSTSDFWAQHSSVNAGGGRGNGRQAGGASAGRLDQVKGKGRGAVSAAMLDAFQALCPERKMPPPAHMKMLNWRTSQVVSAGIISKSPGHEKRRTCVLDQGTTEQAVFPLAPALVLTGDWCAESSFEGCALSASAAANEVLRKLEQPS